MKPFEPWPVLLSVGPMGNAEKSACKLGKGFIHSNLINLSHDQRAQEHEYSSRPQNTNNSAFRLPRHRGSVMKVWWKCEIDRCGCATLQKRKKSAFVEGWAAAFRCCCQRLWTLQPGRLLWLSVMTLVRKISWHIAAYHNSGQWPNKKRLSPVPRQPTLHRIALCCSHRSSCACDWWPVPDPDNRLPFLLPSVDNENLLARFSYWEMTT